MTDRSNKIFSLPRFLWRAALWSSAAGIAWYYTHTWNASLVLAVTRLGHWLVGRPAPYLLSDANPLFWHSAMFAPVVGLTLASYWIRWPGRAARAVVCYLALVITTAVTVTVNESPYLPQSKVLLAMTATMVDANLTLFGLVLWALSAGPWYRSGRGRCVAATGAGDSRRKASGWKRAYRVISGSWGTRVALFVLGICLIVPAAALTGSAESRRARAEVAHALRQVPVFPHPSHKDLALSTEQRRAFDQRVVAALQAIEKAIQIDDKEGMGSAALYHLTGHLLLMLRPDDPEAARQFRLQAAQALVKAQTTRAGR